MQRSIGNLYLFPYLKDKPYLLIGFDKEDDTFDARIARVTTLPSTCPSCISGQNTTEEFRAQSRVMKRATTGM